MSDAALAHRSMGEGPPLVILHGLFGSGVNWRSVARHLAGRYTVHLVDLRNHGASAHARGMHYRELAADVQSWAREHAPGRLTLVGHSMGGKTAMWLALNGMLELERLCVVDIAPVAYAHPEHEDVIAALSALDLESLRSRAEAERALAERIESVALRRFLLQNLVSESAGYRWRINLGALRDGLPDLLDFPRETQAAAPFRACPAACLRGAQSHYVAPPHDQAFFRCFPEAAVETIEGAGHWPHSERPRDFAAALDRFLDHPPAAAP